MYLFLHTKTQWRLAYRPTLELNQVLSDARRVHLDILSERVTIPPVGLISVHKEKAVIPVNVPVSTKRTQRDHEPALESNQVLSASVPHRILYSSRARYRSASRSCNLIPEEDLGIIGWYS